MRRLFIVGVLYLVGLTAFSGCSPEPSSEAGAPSRSGGSGSLTYYMKDFIVPGPEGGTGLAGTLTLPKVGCPCPTAILVQGAGSHDRDYTVFGHKPFEFLADHLARNDIATLRFDERGVGESGGVPGVASPVELAADVMAWIGFLQEQPMVDPARIGIVGHSEGGVVGALVTARSDAVGFLVMLGSPGLPGVEYNLQYEASMGRAMGLPEETIKSRGALQERVLEVVLEEGDPGRAEERLRTIYRELSPPVPEAELERGITRLLSPGFRFNLRHDPAATLGGVDAPVLAVYGGKDVHVPPEGNREAMLSALDTGSGRDRVVVLPGLNHFMQTAPTGSPSEYADIRETLATPALDLIVQWIRTHTGPSPVRSCTVIHAAEGDVVLGASNEDWEDPLTRFWIIPEKNGARGWIKFGFAGGFPQAGMNDAGLFWDATGSPYLAMPASEAQKTFYDGPLMVKVMEEAGSVAEAREIFGAYYCEDQYRAQYLVGDAEGASMIVEGDSLLTKEGRSQVLTNFYQSQPGLGGHPCWRYETATGMLGGAEVITPLLMGQVLDATHQEGKYPTQYSIIFDLRSRRVYLFFFHNFHEYVLIDLEDELQKGARHHDIPPLFSQVRLTGPAYGASVAGSSVEFRWSGRPSSSYDLCYSASPDPVGNCTRIQPKTVARKVGGGVLLGTFSIFLVLLAIPAKSRRCWWPLACLALALLAAGAACGSDPTAPPNEETEVGEMSHLVSGLQPGTTYYWKLLVQPAGSTGLSSESIVFNFSTAE